MTAGDDRGREPAYWERYQDTEFYGSSQYGGLGVYGSQGTGEKPRSPWPKRAAIIGLSLVIVAGLITIAVLVTKGRKDNTATPGASTTVTTTTTTARTTTPTASPSPGQSVPVVPQVTGWQGVWTKNGLAYDVPQAWKPLSTGTLVGYEDDNGKPTLTMNGASNYLSGFCVSDSKRKNEERGLAGFTSSPNTDAAAAAKEAVQKWAQAKYGDKTGEQPKIEVGTPEPTKLGTRDGVRVLGRVTKKKVHDCDAPSAIVQVIAAGSSAGTGMFIVLADQDVPLAISEKDVQLMGSSVRTIPK